jgi:anti-sigma B factor antagonist
MSDSVHDDSHGGGLHDSDVRHAGDPHGVLKVYETGPLTVVGFGGEDVPDEVCIAGYRDQLSALLESSGCRELAVDLTGVKLVPSGMLGLLTSLRKRVEKLSLYNPSPDVRDVLRITNLDQLFDIREVGM